jgi:hypothetical protein
MVAAEVKAERQSKKNQTAERDYQNALTKTRTGMT